MVRALPWLVAALFCAGVVAGTAAFWPASNGTKADPHQQGPGLVEGSSSHAPPSADQHPGSGQPAESARESHLAELVSEGILDVDRELAGDAQLVPESLLVQSRELILAGGFERAATLIRRHKDSQSPGQSPRWAECQVWLGLAEELAGNLRQAEAAYATALRHRPGNKAEVFALAGLVRIWLAGGRVDEALELATDLYLQSGLLTRGDGWAAAEINWLLAMSLVESERLAKQGRGLTSPLWFELPPPAVELMVSALWPAELESGETSLEETDPPPPPALQAAFGNDEGLPAALAEHATAAGDPATPHPVPNVGGDLGNIDVNLPAQTFQQLYQQIASGPGWSVVATTSARDRLAGRAKSILVTSQPVGLLLDLLSLSESLAWQVQGRELRLDLATPDEVSAMRLRCGADLLARFAEMHPADRRHAWCQVARGNLALELGQADEAAQHWHEAWRLGATGELAAGLLVNQSLLSERLGRLDDARRQLYDAIDSTWNLGLQGEAWSRIARLALARGEFAEARHAASRSARLASDDTARRGAALALATAYLLEDNPWAANQVIFESRDLLGDSPVAAEAAFLGSYSRYLGSQTTVAKNKEEPRLLAALTASALGPGLTPAGASLVSDAWRRLGFNDRAAQAITSHVTVGAGEYWDGRLALMLAECRKLDGAPDDAARVLGRVARQADSNVSAQATLELARLQHSKGDYSAAISSARSLLDPAVDDTFRKAALGVMGSAYQRLEQPYAAALCFAGICPLDEPAGTPGGMMEEASFPVEHTR